MYGCLKDYLKMLITGKLAPHRLRRNSATIEYCACPCHSSCGGGGEGGSGGGGGGGGGGNICAISDIRNHTDLPPQVPSSSTYYDQATRAHAARLLRLLDSDYYIHSDSNAMEVNHEDDSDARSSDGVGASGGGALLLYSGEESVCGYHSCYNTYYNYRESRLSSTDRTCTCTAVDGISSSNASLSHCDSKFSNDLEVCKDSSLLSAPAKLADREYVNAKPTDREYINAPVKLTAFNAASGDRISEYATLSEDSLLFEPTYINASVKRTDRDYVNVPVAAKSSPVELTGNKDKPTNLSKSTNGKYVNAPAKKYYVNVPAKLTDREYVNAPAKNYVNAPAILSSMDDACSDTSVLFEPEYINDACAPAEQSDSASTFVDTPCSSDPLFPTSSTTRLEYANIESSNGGSGGGGGGGGGGGESCRCSVQSKGEDNTYCNDSVPSSSPCVYCCPAQTQGPSTILKEPWAQNVGCACSDTEGKLSYFEVLDYAHQIALGMEHLEQMKVS